MCALHRRARVVGAFAASSAVGVLSVRMRWLLVHSLAPSRCETLIYNVCASYTRSPLTGLQRSRSVHTLACCGVLADAARSRTVVIGVFVIDAARRVLTQRCARRYHDASLPRLGTRGHQVACVSLASSRSCSVLARRGPRLASVGCVRV